MATRDAYSLLDRAVSNYLTGLKEERLPPHAFQHFNKQQAPATRPEKELRSRYALTSNISEAFNFWLVLRALRAPAPSDLQA
jgi:hypothetical protein